MAHFAGRDIRDRTLARLTAQGILEVEKGRFFAFLPSVSRTRCYPADQARRGDARLRILRAPFSNDIPDPNDVVIIGLANACGVFERLLSPAEREAARERTALLGRMDLIDRAATEVIQHGGPEGPFVPSPHRPVPKPPFISVLLGTAFIRREYLQLGVTFEI